MRFTTLLSLSALAVAPLGTLAAPAAAAAPSLGDDLQNGAIVATDHSLDKRGGTPWASHYVKLKLAVGSSAFSGLANWGMIFNMVADPYGPVRANALVIPQNSIKGAKIAFLVHQQTRKTYDYFERNIGFVFSGSLAGQDVKCTLSVIMAGSPAKTSIIHLTNLPACTVGGVPKTISSWNFEPYQ